MYLSQLIKKVRSINEDAARYLETDAPRLSSWAVDDSKIKCRDYRITNIMILEETKQGSEFWMDIMVAARKRNMTI